MIKVLNRATGEVSNTVIKGSTVAERALTQIGNTAGYDLVSRMNTPPKYPLVVYEPRVTALSTVNYFNTLSDVQGIGYVSSGKEVVPYIPNYYSSGPSRHIKK